MKVSIDTKEDSHDEIRKVIKMLQNLVGDYGEVLINQPETQENTANAFAGIFGDATTDPQSATIQPNQEPQQGEQESLQEETSESTEDLFAELFSGEELEKMKQAETKEEEEEPKSKNKKHDIEFY